MLKSQTILQLFLQSANVVCDYSFFFFFDRCRVVIFRQCCIKLFLFRYKTPLKFIILGNSIEPALRFIYTLQECSLQTLGVQFAIYPKSFNDFSIFQNLMIITGLKKRKKKELVYYFSHLQKGRRNIRLIKTQLN